MEKTILKRRTIRVFDPNFKIDDQEVLDMIDLSQRAPSSNNLQPWRFVVVRSDDGKEKVRDILNTNKSQLETSSHLIFVFADKNKYQKGLEISKRAYEEGIIPKEVSVAQQTRYAKLHNEEKTDLFYNTMFYDCGLVSSNLIHIAKNRDYDTCIMGGFKRELVNEALGIDNSFLPVVVIALGKAASGENGFETYRLPANETTKFM